MDALVQELRRYPSESELSYGFERGPPSVSYMQALSAVVKLVGGGQMMGKGSTMTSQMGRVFVIDGSR